MPQRREKPDINERKPFTPTIILFAFLIIGIIVMAYGLKTDTTINFYGVEVSTTSLGFAIFALDGSLLLGLTLIGIRAGKKGEPEYPYYDPMPRGKSPPERIICPDCGKSYSNSLIVCPNCGHKRQLY